MRRTGFTILDMLAVLIVTGILLTIAAPRAAVFLDSIRVHGAASDAFAVVSAARNVAATRSAQTTVDIDTVRQTISVRVGADTVRKRELGLVHDVKLSANRTTLAFSASGVAYGAANLTLVIRRGKALDSIFISRLGRVRH